MTKRSHYYQVKHTLCVDPNTTIEPGNSLPSKIEKSLEGNDVDRLLQIGAIVKVDIVNPETGTEAKAQGKQSDKQTDEQVAKKIMALAATEDKNWTAGGPHTGKPQAGVLGCPSEQRDRVWDLTKSDYLDALEESRVDPGSTGSAGPTGNDDGGSAAGNDDQLALQSGAAQG